MNTRTALELESRLIFRICEGVDPLLRQAAPVYHVAQPMCHLVPLAAIEVSFPTPGFLPGRQGYVLVVPGFLPGRQDYFLVVCTLFQVT